jgi:single-stranded-DNA-specific exonuclease
VPEAALPSAAPPGAESPPRLALVSERGSPRPESLTPESLAPESPTPLPPPAPRLEIAPYDFAAALALERELGVSHALSQILVRRGLADPGAANRFLQARERHDPRAFAGLDDALATIRRHIDTGTRITVHGDYDVDGISATATLVRALRSLGADVGWFLPSRIDDGYGVAAATVERLASRGTGLLITVDCGITAVEEAALARSRGIDVVVTDHHSPRPDGELPDCPIVHPGLSGYPCPDLCGTGVAFKLAQALGAPTADADIELVALATVADLVPLRGENRRLVREGLHAMANSVKPGMRALMSVSRVDPSELDTHALGFRLAPRINAAGRMRRPDAGLELLLCEDPARAHEIARELDIVNAERRAVEERICWEAEAQVAELGERSAYVLAGAGWHQGVVGIVASRVVERHHRPTIVIALDDSDPAGAAHGSARSVPGFDLLGALHAAAPHMERYGGHRMAAGLTVLPERIDGLREAIEEHAASVLTPELLAPVERIDAIASGAELGLALAEELRALEPCGIGNPGPRLLVPGARFIDQRSMGEGRHARFSVISGGARARAVAFGCDGHVAGDADTPVDGCFKLERNVWRGAVEPRLVLRHSRPCAPAAPIEVVGEPGSHVIAAMAEITAMLHPSPPPSRDAAIVIERFGESPLAVLGDAAVAAGAGPTSAVLAVCADVPRRLPGLAARVGGFAIAAYGGLDQVVGAYSHVVALDPPSSSRDAALLRAHDGFTHLAWGAAELRFAEQMHELEYGLRTPLVTIFRALRDRGTVAGEELECLLRGDESRARPARLAGRVVRVLVELGLVSLDRDLPALSFQSTSSTELERSEAYRVYMTRHEDGRRFLSRSANLRASV